MRERGQFLRVRTPEGVTFSLTLASPASRFYALLIDLLFIVVVTSLFEAVTSPLRLFSSSVAFAVQVLLFFALNILYPILFEWFLRGQTIGKRLFHLRVVDEEGLTLTFSQVVVRNILRAIDSLPAFYMVGGIACLLSRHMQRLGDKAAGTVVVWERPVQGPEVEQMMAGELNSMRDFPLQMARLRQRADPEAPLIALDALLRREHLDPPARVELFREIADYFRSCVPFPDQATMGLSDEQYVRNVVDIFFRK